MLHALIWIQATTPQWEPDKQRALFSGASGPTQGTAPTPSNTPAPFEGGSNPLNDVPPAQRALTQWTGSVSDACAELQQWMQFAPQRLHEGLCWSQGHSHLPPQTSAHLLLYAGKDDATSLDSCIRKLFPDLSTELIALDIRRDGKEVKHDLLRDQPYSDLRHRALEGQLEGVGGGPNCRTWSILRWIPKPGAPPPVRGRREPYCWGLLPKHHRPATGG